MYYEVTVFLETVEDYFLRLFIVWLYISGIIFISIIKVVAMDTDNVSNGISAYGDMVFLHHFCVDLWNVNFNTRHYFSATVSSCKNMFISFFRFVWISW